MLHAAQLFPRVMLLGYTCCITSAVCVNCTAFLNPEDLDKLWMEAPKSKPAKQHQQPMLSKQGSLEKGHSHEGLLGHAGDSTDDTAAASNKQTPQPHPPTPDFAVFLKEPNCSSGPTLSHVALCPLAVPLLTMA